MAALDDAGFRARFSGSPVKRIGRDRFARNVAVAIGNSADPALRREQGGDLRRSFAAAIGQLEHDELVRRLTGRGCIFSGYATPSDVLADPAAAANGYLMAHPTQTGLRLGAPPVQFDDTAPQIRRPAPGIGQHSDEILAELPYTGDDAAAFLASRAVAGDPAVTPPR